MAAPSNDDLINAVVIDGSTTISGVSTREATLETGEPETIDDDGRVDDDPTGKTVWYSYSPTSDGSVTFNTSGSNYDTTLQVYRVIDTSQPVSFANIEKVPLGGDDDTAGVGETGSFVTFAAVSGARYFIQVGGYLGDSGDLSFRSAGPVCYARGSLIRTASGEVPVEALAVGQLLVTASGEHRPVRWLGQRVVACRGRADVLPIRIAAQAFGEGRPARDLFVSPAHAIAVDVLGEVLIPAGRLVNGTTITQVEAETVSYWHVELDGHDILLAEGLPAESYLDCGNRRFFANAEATDLTAVPDARPPGPLPFCRPFHEAGPLVELVRARLRERAEALGWTCVAETFAGLHLVADDRVIRPDIVGLTARFVLPADARDVRLVSEPSVPADVVPGAGDRRRLGLALAALTLDDGLTGTRCIALDDPRLGEGFHAAEDNTRWTDGSARLPAELWAGCRGTVFLQVRLAGPALPRWVAPPAADETRRRA